MLLMKQLMSLIIMNKYLGVKKLKFITSFIFVLIFGLGIIGFSQVNGELKKEESESGVTRENTDDIKKMSGLQAGVLGLVEGITEYLPVSSTGHLIVTQKLLGISPDNEEESNAANAYVICIQLGAIVAVLGLYSKRFKSILLGIIGKDKNGLKLLINILVAFSPAVALGLLFDEQIKKYLFSIWPIITAWFVGGIFMLWISPRTNPAVVKGKGIEEMDWKDSLKIGIIQCIAMWPGVSRSYSTIIGGIFSGLSVAAAVEFSFLLGVVTLGGTTFYEGYKYAGTIFSTYGYLSPIIGFVVAFVSAVLAIKWLVSYLNSHGMQVFGWYRIAIALIVAIFVILNFPAGAWISLY